jgi:ABC-2 type transport system ATP-binding protein
MDPSVSISAEGITKYFGRVVAVKDLSLNVRRGEIYGFLGLNGAGKTTTIRMLLGMIRPSAGSIHLFGTKIQPGERSIWERVGYLVETPHAYPDLTVRENLELVRRLRKVSRTRVVEEIIAQLGLTQYAGRRARNLSLGNAQRLGLAKALIHHPDLLVLDEPANALDPAGIVEIRNLLRNLAEKDGVTIFISSHILTEVAQLAMRIGIVHEGRLVKEVNATTIAQEKQRKLEIDVTDIVTARSVLGKSGFVVNSNGQNGLVLSEADAVEHPDKVATLLVQAGCAPTRLVVLQRDLESYFLETVGVQENHK